MLNPLGAARPGDAFAQALLASERHPTILAAEDIYAPLLGIWDVTVRDYLEDGREIEGHGEWLFARVLDGRAIQDVWIVPSRCDAPRERHPCERYGSSIRTFDPNLRRWRVTWLNPVSGAFDMLWARAEDGRIVQEGSSSTGQEIDWTFARITPTEMHWIGKGRDENGNWRLEAEFFGRRRA